MHDLLAMHRHMAAGMFALARGGGGDSCTCRPRPVYSVCLVCRGLCKTCAYMRVACVPRRLLQFSHHQLHHITSEVMLELKHEPRGSQMGTLWEYTSCLSMIGDHPQS